MPFLSQLSADVHRAVEDAGMAMTLSVHSSDLVCWCDACQLRDVLQQLVDNAVKFASGGKYLELSARQCAVSDLPPSSRRLVLHEPTPESRWVMIEVADHGPGIPAEAIDRLFGAFEQGEEHLSRKVRGLGIGLAVVRRVIELNGGTLWVDSVPGGGTKVSLTLPQFDPSQQL